jgi:hypothetical protein
MSCMISLHLLVVGAGNSLFDPNPVLLGVVRRQRHCGRKIAPPPPHVFFKKLTIKVQVESREALPRKGRTTVP